MHYFANNFKHLTFAVQQLRKLYIDKSAEYSEQYQRLKSNCTTTWGPVAIGGLEVIYIHYIYTVIIRIFTTYFISKLIVNVQ